MKILRKVSCLAMAAVTAMLMSVSASAESEVSTSVPLTESNMTYDLADTDFVLVSEETIEEEDWTATLETYVEDGIDALSSNSGTKRYRCQGTFYDTDTKVKWVTMWVEGTFSWNQEANTATVEKCDSDYDLASNAFEKKDETLTNGDNKGGWWGGNRYAFVEEKLVLTNGAGQNTFKLWLDVNVKGETNVKADKAKSPTLEEVK